jgi:hypothetical protein
MTISNRIGLSQATGSPCCASVQEYAWGNCAGPGRLARAVGITRRLMIKPYPVVAGSGDEQAKAKLCCVEIDEVVVAFDPPT